MILRVCIECYRNKEIQPIANEQQTIPFCRLPFHMCKYDLRLFVICVNDASVAPTMHKFDQILYVFPVTFWFYTNPLYQFLG